MGARGSHRDCGDKGPNPQLGSRQRVEGLRLGDAGPGFRLKPGRSSIPYLGNMPKIIVGIPDITSGLFLVKGDWTFWGVQSAELGSLRGRLPRSLLPNIGRLMMGPHGHRQGRKRICTMKLPSYCIELVSEQLCFSTFGDVFAFLHG